MAKKIAAKKPGKFAAEVKVKRKELVPPTRPIKALELHIPNKKELKDKAKRGTGAADMSWEEAGAEMRKDPVYHISKNPTPVESHLPGVPRVPKPKKVIPPLAAPTGGLGLEPLAHLEIVSYHFLKLMERLAAEQGGTSAQALEDLRADIAKRKKP